MARGPFITNAFGQLASRAVTSGVPASAIAMLYDRDGNLVAEAHAVTGATMRAHVRPACDASGCDSAAPG